MPQNSSAKSSANEFRGVQLIDIRVLVQLDEQSAIPVPTKKGVSLRVELLPELVAALQAAEAEARQRGLLIDTKEEAAA
jgi:hypothetical protein